MKINPQAVRDCLKAFDFSTLFREHLGWDAHKAQLAIPIDGQTYTLNAVSQKRGFIAFVCDRIPERATRLRIDHQVTKSAREHFIVYADKASGQQIWQWVRREPGKPLASRDHRFDQSQTGEALIQRLDRIAVSMEEEEEITIVEVAGRNRAAFDVDRVTKRFYDRFKTEHAAFLKTITGFPPPVKSGGKAEPHPDHQWYTSLMLNRLMFVYFIQKKGFLDGDLDYLRTRLAMVQQMCRRPADGEGSRDGCTTFLTFYRYFLLRLFHDGLGKSPGKRGLDPVMEKLIGRIPYLNGGFFEVHKLERDYTKIEIPDKAFERLFDFFDQYNWHLDERPLRKDNEINPDVVGCIFEKYINQKQMGAYYTKEDITEYISKNTIIPYLFDAAKKKCAIAFKSGSALWRLLVDDPDRYIYPAMRQGVVSEKGDIIPLPAEIEAGIDDVSKRDGWNRAAEAPFALPTETWREHVARRQRCLEIREILKSGAGVPPADSNEAAGTAAPQLSINELITLNLDIWQFARDVIVNAEGPELLRAFWHAIQTVTVLDPTCGSGAFVFAALRILETLYSDCLERMERFVEDASVDEASRLADSEHNTQLKATSRDGSSTQKYRDFREVLAKTAEHPNERYFILKSIILNNLYGVDIMEEAVEICKLRLFLKLVAQVETFEQIEPLPDVDFNIRAGNTLVGFATMEQVKQSMQGDFIKQMELPRIEESAENAARAFQQFREQQTTHGGTVTPEDKQALRDRLGALNDELDRYLATEYGVNVEKPEAFNAWKASHQPFHWLVEFYSIMHAGGFCVIIGNPPYVEYSKVKSQYSLLPAYAEFWSNLYAACTYRSLEIRDLEGRISLIVPVSLPSTDRMMPLRKMLLLEHSIHCVNFSTRPSKLFEGAEQRLCIFIQSPSQEQKLFSGGYLKWSTSQRSSLFSILEFVETRPINERNFIWPKLRTKNEVRIFERISGFSPANNSGYLNGDQKLYYKNTGIRYFNTVTLRPPLCWINDVPSSSSRETILTVHPDSKSFIHCLLLSSTFFLYYQSLSNCRDLNPSDINLFPIPLINTHMATFDRLSSLVENDYTQKGKIICMNNRLTGQVKLESVSPKNSKPIIDEIDRVLAQHYGFTDEELDYIINYDIKYRMGGAEED